MSQFCIETGLPRAKLVMLWEMSAGLGNIESVHIYDIPIQAVYGPKHVPPLVEHLLRQFPRFKSVWLAVKAARNDPVDGEPDVMPGQPRGRLVQGEHRQDQKALEIQQPIPFDGRGGKARARVLGDAVRQEPRLRPASANLHAQRQHYGDEELFHPLIRPAVRLGHDVGVHFDDGGQI